MEIEITMDVGSGVILKEIYYILEMERDTVTDKLGWDDITFGDDVV